MTDSDRQQRTLSDFDGVQRTFDDYKGKSSGCRVAIFICNTLLCVLIYLYEHEKKE